MMSARSMKFPALISLIPAALLTGIARAATAPTSYPAMAPVDQYMMPDAATEAALARTAAPASVGDSAGVMVLGKHGYTTVAKGSSGFMCLVERSWGASTTDPDFWNPEVRSPVCFNPAAARTLATIFMVWVSKWSDGSPGQAH